MALVLARARSATIAADAAAADFALLFSWRPGESGPAGQGCLEVSSLAGTRVRTVEARSCDEAMEALALIASMLLDAEASGVLYPVPSPTAAPAPAPSVASAASAAPQAVRTATAPMPEAATDRGVARTIEVGPGSSNAREFE